MGRVNTDICTYHKISGLQLWSKIGLYTSCFVKSSFLRKNMRKNSSRSSHVLVVITAIHVVLLSIVRGAPVQDQSGAMTFLKKYRYMGHDHPDSEFADLTDQAAFDMALQVYQQNMGLNTTGTLDSATMEMMAKPRCGMADIMSMRDVMKRRRKRYTIGESRWVVSPLYYKFLNYSPKLTQQTIEDTIERAFTAWSEVTPVKFELVGANDDADIEILFSEADHAEQDQETVKFDEVFDGPGGTLAHAFYPIYGGNAHFDDAESWFVNSDKVAGIDLFFVALHELGHSLGMGHSTVPDAVMFPTYPGFVPQLRLQPDDIQGIQALYGVPPSNVMSTTRRPGWTTVQPGNDKATFCNRETVDAIVRVNDMTFVFQGNIFAVVDDTKGIQDGYPLPTQDYWEGITGNVDAALEIPGTNQVFLFKGRNCWLYAVSALGTAVLVNGFPRGIGSVFPGLNVDSIDAAFIWGANGRAYVFSDDEFFRLSRGIVGSPDSGYPKPVSLWGLPSPIVSHISGAYSSANMRTYFFSGNEYYRYNDMALTVDEKYPQPISGPFFGCSGDDDMEMEEPYDQFTNMMGVGPTMCLPGMRCDKRPVSTASITTSATLVISLAFPLLCFVLLM